VRARRTRVRGRATGAFVVADASMVDRRGASRVDV
jgi:hypothetical protein